MLAAPLGIVGGYMLTYYMNKYHSWEWSFYLQSGYHSVLRVPAHGARKVSECRNYREHQKINTKGSWHRDLKSPGQIER